MKRGKVNHEIHSGFSGNCSGSSHGNSNSISTASKDSKGRNLRHRNIRPVSQIDSGIAEALDVVAKSRLYYALERGE